MHKLHTTLALLCLSTPAWAGPPFVTDDPEPVAERSWEVNYTASKTWAEAATTAAMPSVDINYGLSKNIQLHALPKYSAVTDGDAKHTGVDNTEIGVKYRFLHEEQNEAELMLAIYPMLQLATGEQKLGDASGKTQIFLPVWAQLNMQKWTFYGGTGYRINHYADSKNSWFVGGTALYAVTDKLKLGAELFRESAAAKGDDYTSGFNVGGSYSLAKDYGLLFSSGRALNNIAASNQNTVFLALQVNY